MYVPGVRQNLAVVVNSDIHLLKKGKKNAFVGQKGSWTHIILLKNKYEPKGATGIEPVTSRSAVECRLLDKKDHGHISFS